jgi:hypothetical protein
VQIGGLPPEEAGQLLVSAVAGRVDRGVSERIIAQTGGNPQGLIELSGELSREQLAGETSLPELLPVGGSLQVRYLPQIGVCPPGDLRATARTVGPSGSRSESAFSADSVGRQD